jgi:hypothetical protein
MARQHSHKRDENLGKYYKIRYFATKITYTVQIVNGSQDAAYVNAEKVTYV